jgi:DNA repair protein RadD
MSNSIRTKSQAKNVAARKAADRKPPRDLGAAAAPAADETAPAAAVDSRSSRPYVLKSQGAPAAGQDIRLRDYQSAALSALFTYWRAGGGNPLVDLATGTGKSIVIADLVRQLYIARRDRRFLILAHVRELIEQNVRALLAVWPEAEFLIGINSAGLGQRQTDAPIVFGTIQTCFRNPQALGPRNLAIIDEAHLIPRAGEGMYQTTIAALRELYAPMRVAGLTATPWRTDSGRLDEGEGRLFDRVVHSYGIGEATRAGWLAPLVAKAPTGEIDVAGIGKRGGEFIAGELERAADQDALVETATREIVTYGDQRRAWLVFCCGVGHAFHVRDALRALGINTQTVTGETSGDERTRIFDAFRRGEIRCLTGCQVFTTGFDIPQIDLIALMRPTWSPCLLVQMAGRGSRKVDGKTNCLLLDFGGNVRRHGPIDLIGASVGTAGEKADVVPTKVCPSCESIVPAGTMACPDCGHVWPVRAPKHDVRADILSPMSDDETWLGVHGIEFFHHDKKDGSGAPSLRIEYRTITGYYREWLPFETPKGRWIAEQKWAELGGDEPVPQTVDEALARTDEIENVTQIAIRFDGKFWTVVERRRGAP